MDLKETPRYIADLENTITGLARKYPGTEAIFNHKYSSFLTALREELGLNGNTIVYSKEGKEYELKDIIGKVSFALEYHNSFVTGVYLKEPKDNNADEIFYLGLRGNPNDKAYLEFELELKRTLGLKHYSRPSPSNLLGEIVLQGAISKYYVPLGIKEGDRNSITGPLILFSYE